MAQEENPYLEHLRFLIKQEMGARAELQGFRDAKWMYKLPLYSRDRYEQDRYVNGFQDGKTIISLGKAS